MYDVQPQTAEQQAADKTAPTQQTVEVSGSIYELDKLINAYQAFITNADKALNQRIAEAVNSEQIADRLLESQGLVRGVAARIAATDGFTSQIRNQATATLQNSVSLRYSIVSSLREEVEAMAEQHAMQLVHRARNEIEGSLKAAIQAEYAERLANADIASHAMGVVLRTGFGSEVSAAIEEIKAEIKAQTEEHTRDLLSQAQAARSLMGQLKALLLASPPELLHQVNDQYERHTYEDYPPFHETPNDFQAFMVDLESRIINRGGLDGGTRMPMKKSSPGKVGYWLPRVPIGVRRAGTRLYVHLGNGIIAPLYQVVLESRRSFWGGIYVPEAKRRISRLYALHARTPIKDYLQFKSIIYHLDQNEAGPTSTFCKSAGLSRQGHSLCWMKPGSKPEEVKPEHLPPFPTTTKDLLLHLWKCHNGSPIEALGIELPEIPQQETQEAIAAA